MAINKKFYFYFKKLNNLAFYQFSQFKEFINKRKKHF